MLMGGTASKAMAVAKNLRDHGVSHVARAGGGGAGWERVEEELNTDAGGGMDHCSGCALRLNCNSSH